jgi:hypothetical protein
MTMSPRATNNNLVVTSALVGLATAAVTYIGTELAGVNVLRYYPVLHVFQTETIPDQISMGFYGRLLVAAVAAVVAVMIYLIFYKVFYFFRLARIAYLSILAFGVLWMSAAIIVWEEWHKWGIEARDASGSGFFNSEFSLFVVGTLVFLIGAFLSASGAQRVAHISREATKPVPGKK